MEEAAQKEAEKAKREAEEKRRFSLEEKRRELVRYFIWLCEHNQYVLLILSVNCLV